MNDGVAPIVEIDKTAIERRLKHKYLEMWTDDIEAIKLTTVAKNDRRSLSVGLLGNATEVHPDLVK